jgi:hypothetical protein
MIDTVIAYLDSGLSLEDLDSLPPAKLDKFAMLLDHWRQLAERRVIARRRPSARNGEHTSR